MNDKVCLITGATSGIGLASALGLAQRGATLILVGRNRARGAKALARIREQTGCTSARYLSADLSVQVQVRQLARDVQDRYPRLDVLINNAGGFFHKRQESAEGIEMNWALHVLGPFLLTSLLVPRLRASAPSRVINVSSAMQRVGRMRFQDLEHAGRYNRVGAYSQSKLAEILLSYEWARRMAGTGVTVNALDPGFVASNIISGHGGKQWKLGQAVYNMFVASPDQGARTVIYVASSPEVGEATGLFFRACKPVRSSPASYDVEASRQLWNTCLEMTAEASPE